MKKSLFLCCALWMLAAYAGPVQFLSKPMSAGKALLAENAYSISRLLDTANFSPELKLPVQLFYNSSGEKSGLFGFAWRSPQLESTAYYDKDGVLWVTPWGEKIKFFPKKEQTPKDSIKIELYEQAKKGRGFYAPYSEWEADTSKRDYAKSDDWVFRGKRDKKGWTFVYRDYKLRSITAPSGRIVEFNYENKRLISVSQDRTAFIELGYSGNLVTSLKINGIDYELKYGSTKLQILPKTEKGNIISAARDCLVSVQRGNLAPVTLAYDDYGFLNRIQQGDYTDDLVIQHQTLAERRTELLSAKDSKIKYSGPANGRILSDNQFKYAYSSPKPGAVTLTNQLNQKATFHFNAQTGIFQTGEFSGKSYTIYYFMRHDVAYLGKVRKIVDSRGRDVINYRYDKLSGNVIRVRDMAGNDINFEYGQNGKLARITRRAADQDTPEPVKSFGYDKLNNLTAISTLNASGEAVVTTSLEYTPNREVASVSNGQSKSKISYNSFGYPVTVTNVFGQTTQRELDKYNRMISSTDFYDVKTYYTYTPAGLITQIERKDGEKLLTSLSIAYNANGQPIRYTEQSGKAKEFERDAFGRVIKELFPDDTEVAYTYNKLGQLHTVLDQNKHKITFDWNKFGLDAKTTPAGQLTDYVHDKYGMLAKIDSKWHGKTDRSIKYEYDQFDRIVKVDYGNGNVETRAYDSWGKLIALNKNGKKSTFQYDYFGRLIRKTDGALVYRYTYNPYGQRTGMELKNDGLTHTEIKTYDEYGRLVSIKSKGKTVVYQYNDRNQLAAQIVDKIPIEFTYTRYGQLETKTLGGKAAPISTLKYIYSSDGMIAGRVVDGKFQMYFCDKRGQLLRVADMQGNVAECYVYDPAGNILSKTIDGKTTTYTYDKANQLVSSTCNGKVTHYAYDAAGRLIKEGDKSYAYGWLDKVLSVTENGQQIASFNYHNDGQIAQAIHNGKSEDFLWDGLALIHRGETSFINEPYVTGGNPILSSKDGVMFNDMLGSTLNIGGKAVNMTAFGESADSNAMYTGKPYIGVLGYAFLFRNYRSDYGKWQTTDPLGYPDGWNNLAYVNNKTVNLVDFLGGWATIPIINVNDHAKFFTQNRITYEGMTLNSEYFEQLKRSNYLVDSAEYQDENSAFMHAMKRSSDSDAVAINKINNFIDEMLEDARNAVVRYEQGYNTLDYTCNFIIQMLGVAGHTYQDRMCPEHFSEGTPQTWYSGGLWNPINYQHAPELWKSPSAANINDFTSWTCRELSKIIGGNKDVICKLFE